MLEESLFSIALPYRQDMQVKAFSFGIDKAGRILGGQSDPASPEDFEKSLCIVGGMRGNEVQQTYICSQLVRKLESLEQKGLLQPGRLFRIIPCVNPASMNICERFWVGDKTDINRMMPGYNLGETTQRIAGGLFEAVRGFKYGIHFSSYYLNGDFMEHVRVMEQVGAVGGHGQDFGLPYVLRHFPGSFDTTTLHYNWCLWDTEAYTIYTPQTRLLREYVASNVLRAVLRFMNARGIIDYPCHAGYRSTVMSERMLAAANSPCAGMFMPQVRLGEIVKRGQTVAAISHPLNGKEVCQVRAPRGGAVFFIAGDPLVNQGTLLFQIIPRDVSIDPEADGRGNFLDPEA